MSGRGLFERIEQLWPRIAREAKRPDTGHDANDLYRPAVIVRREAPSEGVLAGEVATGGRLVDDPHAHRAGAIAGLEFAPCEQPNPHSAEIPGADRTWEDGRCVFHPRRRRLALDHYGEAVSHAAERHAGCHCAGANA